MRKETALAVSFRLVIQLMIKQLTIKNGGFGSAVFL